MRTFVEDDENWYKLEVLQSITFICGYCGDKVCSEKGYHFGAGRDGSGNPRGMIMICPSCKGPVFFTRDAEQIPGPAFGNPVSNLPGTLEGMYEEARVCTKNNCYTAAVMICRKILMHIASEQGAEEGLSFAQYVNYLSDQGFIPPNGKAWVDHIRKKGNEANHEIKIMSPDDARDLIIFIEMLLTFIYKFPKMLPEQPRAVATRPTSV